MAAEERIKKNVHVTLVQVFIRAMENYQQVQAHFKHKHEENVTRQVLTGKIETQTLSVFFVVPNFTHVRMITKYGNLVNPNATSDEVADVIQSGEAEQIFANSVQRDQSAQVALNYIRVRTIYHPYTNSNL